jgi:hypothetical protein
MFLIWLAPACGGSPAGVDGSDLGGVRITGSGTATEYVRATALTVDGEIPIPTGAITGMLRVQPMNRDGSFSYQPTHNLTLAVTSANRTVAYWRGDPSNSWKGQVIGLERRPTTLTFSILRKDGGATLFQSAPVTVRFRE